MYSTVLEYGKYLRATLLSKCAYRWGTRMQTNTLSAGWYVCTHTRSRSLPHSQIILYSTNYWVLVQHTVNHCIPIDYLMGNVSVSIVISVMPTGISVGFDIRPSVTIIFPVILQKYVIFELCRRNYQDNFIREQSLFWILHRVDNLKFYSLFLLLKKLILSVFVKGIFNQMLFSKKHLS